MRRIFAFVVILFVGLGPVAASAFEVPLLTWERGRVQQVVLGGGATSAKWKLTLEGNGISPLTFSSSAPNSAGYVVYSIEIPKDLPLGAYSVSTSAPGAPKTVVAGVALVEVQTRTATNSLLDLSHIIGLLVFFTALFTTLRAKKYSKMFFSITQPVSLASDLTLSTSFLERLTQAPARIRMNLLRNLRPSLPSYLLVREGEVLYHMSKYLYAVLPFIGIVIGTIAGIEVDRSGGLAKTGLSVFIALTILSIYDSLSGAFAIVSFWAVELFLGNVTSVRDLLLVVGTAISVLAPIVVATLTQHGLRIDLKKMGTLSITSWLAFLLPSVVGGLVFYFGNLLVTSVLYVNPIAYNANATHIFAIIFAIAIKKIYESEIQKKFAEGDVSSSEFFIARVNSPSSALALNLIIFAFVYVWTQDFAKSLEVSLLFSIPYYLAFVRFTNSAISRIPRITRNLLVESTFMAVIAYILFKQISMRPLLNDQMAIMMLFATAIPGIFHAAYSAVCSSSEKEEIIQS